MLLMHKLVAPLKVLGTLLSVVLIVVGFWGFLFAWGSSEKTGQYNSPKPMYSVNRIAVDSRGNLYYGLSELDSVQVYSNGGEFLYRVAFSGNGVGHFVFIVDENDILHIAGSRTSGVLSFHDGVLVGEHKYTDDNDRLSIQRNYERLGAKTFYDKGGNKYLISGKKVRVFDSQGELTRIVTPSAPIWPFSITTYWGLSFLGILTLVLINIKFFITVAKTSYAGQK